MDGASLARIRWRLHGAWMWPTFIVLTILDGVVGHWLPLSGDGQSTAAGWLVGLFASLAGIIVLSPVLGMILRRARGDMPKVVARDYAGTAVIMAVSAILLTIGIVHHSSVMNDQRALEDAVARAEAFIGDRAPAEFRTQVLTTSTYEIEAGIYRTCVRNRQRTKSYCVIVRRDLPFAQSVRFGGYEPNSDFSQGAW